MTNEFEIQFSFENKSYTARVVKSESTNEKVFAVRPFSKVLAKQFGPQILICKQNDFYHSDSMLSRTNPSYIKAIVSVLKHRKY